jgi:hypothetical protein
MRLYLFLNGQLMLDAQVVAGPFRGRRNGEQ